MDNGSSGGIGCKLDENGVIVDTCDAMGRKYEYHPTTNKRLIGFQVPDISAALDLAKRLSALCPEVRFVGWDIALSKDGFVVIEGNNSASFTCYQLYGNKDFRTFMDSIRQKVEKQ